MGLFELDAEILIWSIPMTESNNTKTNLPAMRKKQSSFSYLISKPTFAFYIALNLPIIVFNSLFRIPRNILIKLIKLLGHSKKEAQEGNATLPLTLKKDDSTDDEPKHVGQKSMSTLRSILVLPLFLLLLPISIMDIYTSRHRTRDPKKKDLFYTLFITLSVFFTSMGLLVSLLPSASRPFSWMTFPRTLGCLTLCTIVLFFCSIRIFFSELTNLPGADLFKHEIMPNGKFSQTTFYHSEDFFGSDVTLLEDKESDSVEISKISNEELIGKLAKKKTLIIIGGNLSTAESNACLAKEFDLEKYNIITIQNKSSQNVIESALFSGSIHEDAKSLGAFVKFLKDNDIDPKNISLYGDSRGANVIQNYLTNFASEKDVKDLYVVTSNMGNNNMIEGFFGNVIRFITGNKADSDSKIYSLALATMCASFISKKLWFNSKDETPCKVSDSILNFAPPKEYTNQNGLLSSRFEPDLKVPQEYQKCDMNYNYIEGVMSPENALPFQLGASIIRDYEKNTNTSINKAISYLRDQPALYHSSDYSSDYDPLHDNSIDSENHDDDNHTRFSPPHERKRSGSSSGFSSIHTRTDLNTSSESQDSFSPLNYSTDNEKEKSSSPSSALTESVNSYNSDSDSEHEGYYLVRNG